LLEYEQSTTLFLLPYTPPTLYPYKIKTKVNKDKEMIKLKKKKYPMTSRKIKKKTCLFVSISNLIPVIKLNSILKKKLSYYQDELEKRG
jgi:hypothetical protein